MFIGVFQHELSTEKNSYPFFSQCSENALSMPRKADRQMLSKAFISFYCVSMLRIIKTSYRLNVTVKDTRI